MVWTLTIIVTYDGEGGTLSLLALLMKKSGRYMPVLFFAASSEWRCSSATQ
jgi:KUP system potassium uptake protein